MGIVCLAQTPPPIALLCLHSDPVEDETAFGVLHITGEEAVIEPVEVSGSHLKWSVSSLCYVAAIVQMIYGPEYHGAVLLYKELSSEIIILRIYLSADNNPSLEKVSYVPKLETEGLHVFSIGP